MIITATSMRELAEQATESGVLSSIYAKAKIGGRRSDFKHLSVEIVTRLTELGFVVNYVAPVGSATNAAAAPFYKVEW